MTDAVLEENADGIVTLTLNRPEQRNPISDDDVLETLIAALARLDADNATRAIIVTGAGSAFSSGGNLKKMGASGGLNDPLPAQTRLNYRRGIQRLPLLIEAMEVPTIAAVNGPAVGAGCDLACMCDLRIASPAATFAETFVRLGLVSGIGGAWFLPRAVGHARAAELAFTGRIIDAGTALDYGLVSEIVPADGLMDRAQALAAEIARNSAPALRYTKRLLRLSERSDLAGCLDATAALQTLAHLSPEHALSVDCYLEEQAGRRAARRQLPT